MKIPALIVAILTILCMTGWECGAFANVRTEDGRILLRTIVLNMGNDGRAVTDTRYDALFRQGNAVSGVLAIIGDERFFINGHAVPGSAAKLMANHPAGFLVNQVPWLVHDSAQRIWKGGYKAEKSTASYDEAVLATVSSIVSGLEVRLYDTDADGYADLIDADYKEGVVIGRIVHNGDGTATVVRADVGPANSTANEGRVFDAARFTPTSGESIQSAHLDPVLKPNDVALFWYGPDGWVFQRAQEVRGIFAGGTDHQDYNIDGQSYQDAMRFSRDNIPVSNRPGEYLNTWKYFGFDLHNQVSLWLVPTSVPGARGAPVALSSGDSARALLIRAISVSEDRLKGVVASLDGSDVPVSGSWVRPEVYAQLEQAIQRARQALASQAALPSVLDYQAYLLYLTLDGSDNDIGARFGGFRYSGFMHQIKSGTAR